jgi:hypothetical protein
MARKSARAQFLRRRNTRRTSDHKTRNWFLGTILGGLFVTIVGTVIATHLDDWTRHRVPPRIVSGDVACASGVDVTGVWVEAASGKGDSGFAHLGAATPSDVDLPSGPTAHFSYRLPHGGAYTLKVGCGGTGKDWATNNYSPQVSTGGTTLRCEDPPPDPLAADPPKGKCHVV